MALNDKPCVVSQCTCAFYKHGLCSLSYVRKTIEYEYVSEGVSKTTCLDYVNGKSELEKLKEENKELKNVVNNYIKEELIRLNFEPTIKEITEIKDKIENLLSELKKGMSAI